MALLRIQNLCVEFETANGPFRAVDGIDLRVDSSERLAIVGESGSGKSVAMLALMGLLPPTATVSADILEFDNQDMLTMSERQRRAIIGKDLAMIFQEPMSSLNPCYRVGYQVKEVLKTHLGMKEKEADDRAVTLFSQVGIPSPKERLDAYPHQLSGGMCQRVMIAMALAGEPKLLIADEPTTALDVTIQAQILDLLLALQEQNEMALIMITHDMGVVAQMAERVSVQYAGQKCEEQLVTGLFDHPYHPYTDALLKALPERASSNILPTIQGVVPGQFDRPDGCLFAPRCDYAKEKCRREKPLPQAAESGSARCFYPLETQDAMNE